MIHEASFNPCTAALPLVLVMMGLGGMYSPEPDVVTKLKLLLDTIESYIYTIPGLNLEYDLPGRIYTKHSDNAPHEWKQYQLEEFQGAYLAVVLQYWNGNAAARRRVRQQRFTRLVVMFRSLEMQNVQHPPMFAIQDQQTFKNWVRVESAIRTAAIITMLDRSFFILNNITPRFQWAETDLPFPSDDSYFTTTNHEELAALSRFPQRKMKIKDAFLLLFTPPDDVERGLKPLRAANLTALDMQVLMHILYTHVWAHTVSNPLISLPTTSIPNLIAPWKCAMQNWKTLWDEIRASAPESEWSKLGFQRTANTYYSAVKSVMQAFERNGGKFPVMPSDCDNWCHLKLLLSC